METLLSRHASLTSELETGGMCLSPSDYAAKAKELAGLQAVAALSNHWKSVESKIKETTALLKECDQGTEDGREMAALRKTTSLVVHDIF